VALGGKQLKLGDAQNPIGGFLCPKPFFGRENLGKEIDKKWGGNKERHPSLLPLPSFKWPQKWLEKEWESKNLFWPFFKEFAFGKPKV